MGRHLLPADQPMVMRARPASSLLLCLVLVIVSTAVSGLEAQTTLLSMTSDPGDYIGDGLAYHFTPADGTFSASMSASDQIDVGFSGATEWHLAFAAPGGKALVPGMYDGAREIPFQAPVEPGLIVSPVGRPCSATGRFSVLELTLGSGGEVQSFAADFEQHCEMAAPALIGSIRFNSGVSLGVRVSVAPALGYEGDGAGGFLTFRLSLSARSTVPVSVDYASVDGTAKAGVDFVPTSGTAVFPVGVTALEVQVPILGNTLAQPDRTFTLELTDPAGAPIGFGSGTGTILDDDGDRTYLYFAGDPDDYIVGDQTFMLTPLDGIISASPTAGGVEIGFGRAQWILIFDAPPGSPFVPGAYEAGTPRALPPRLLVSGDGRGCGEVTGRFVVHEYQLSAANEVERLAIDYEQHCYGAAPALFGSVRINSSIDRTPRVSIGSTSSLREKVSPRPSPSGCLSRRAPPVLSPCTTQQPTAQPWPVSTTCRCPERWPFRLARPWPRWMCRSLGTGFRSRTAHCRWC